MRFVKASIEDYADKHTGRVDKVFEDLRKETYAKCDNPGMQVGKVEGSFLRMLVAISGSRNVLEIGTFTGYSALMMASALPDDGRLLTLESDGSHARVAQKYFDKVDYSKKITIIHGDARDTLDLVEGPIDMAFIDADKSSYDAYYEGVLRILRPGGLMAFDNMLWKGEVLDPRSRDARAIHAMNRKLAKDERVDRVLLTVRDGIMLVRKR
jgi:caffeoyl-CoA O-methyltransferase